MPADVTPERLTVTFHGERGAVAELTWAQRTIWAMHHRYWPNHHYFNFGRLFDVPEECCLAAVARAVRQLVERYEAFRTTVHDGADGQPRQRVAESGEYALDVYEAEDAAAAAERLAYEYSGHAFRDDEWPLRIAVVTREGAPAYVLFMMSHLAVDHWGMEIACAAFIRLLAREAGLTDEAGGGDEAEGGLRQPVDQAAVEASPSGQRMAKRAAEYWRRTLLTIPQSMFPSTVDQARWCPVGELTSTAVAPAADSLASRFGGSASGVILAATAGLLGLRTGNTTVALRLFAANRYGPQARAMVATCVQPALFAVDLRDTTFHELIARSWASSVVAYRHARYPAELIDQVIQEVGQARGVRPDLLCHFHDATFRGAMEAVGPSADPAPDAGEILAASRHSRFRYRVRVGVHQKFLLQIQGQWDSTLRLTLVVDPRYLSRDDAQALVCGIETLLVEAVRRDFSLTEAARLAGVQAPAPA
jgi:hypothetical protein